MPFTLLTQIFLLVLPQACSSNVGNHSLECLNRVWLEQCSLEGTGAPTSVSTTQNIDIQLVTFFYQK